MQFEEVSGRRAEVALELLTEGKAVTYRGLGLQLVDSVLECRLFVQLTHAEALDAARAEREFSFGKAILDELLAQQQFAAALAGRSERWELLWDYYGEAVLLCRLERGKLVWARGWPKAAV